MHTLVSSHWRLWLDPAQGVRWCALQARQGDGWLHLMPDCREGTDPGPAAGLLAASSFVMLPFCNRIRDGQFNFEGRSIQLADADKHSIHGALRKLPWQLDHASESESSCHFDSRDHERAGLPPINWPWPIASVFEHSLSDRRLTSTLSLTNHGDSPMPAGLGWHPYFLREVDGAAPSLMFPVSSVFPDANGDCLPDGAAVDLPAALDFRQERTLDPEQRIDHCFSGLVGDTRIRWPDASVGFTMRASPVCRFAVLYNPDEPFFAVEPVTNANDAFNLEARGIDAGQQVLAPGETLRASMELELDD